MICLFTLRHIPLESVCTHLSVESCVVWNQSTDLQSRSIYWFLYGSVFCWGYFQTDYNTDVFSEAAIEKCSSVVIPVASSFLFGLQTVTRWLYLRMSSFEGVCLFFCIYFTKTFFNDWSPSLNSLENLLTNEGFNFRSFF